MLSSPPVARFPDELVTEIFRNQILSARDLARCALVSRRFLKGVRKVLYGGARVELSTRLSSIYEEEGTEYTESSWKMLRSLLENRRLGRFIKGIAVASGEDVFEEDEKPGTPLETTQALALSTFLRLAPNATGVSLTHGDALADSLAVLSNHTRITRLSVSPTSLEEVFLVVQDFPRLKHLDLTFHELEPEWRRIDVKKLAKLESLALMYGQRTFCSPLIKASSSTLRTLRIGVNMAYKLEYSQFPQLGTLVIFGGDEYDFASRVPKSSVNSAHKAFWKSLCQSPSLTSLAFAGQPFLFSFGDVFNPILSRTSRETVTPIPTLRTLRYTWSNNLDRLQWLLAGPLGTTLHRLVLPSLGLMLSRDSSIELERSVKYEAILAMCNRVGIELCLSDGR